MAECTVNDMELDCKIRNGLMFKPLGERVTPPPVIEYEGQFWELLVFGTDRVACYYPG